MVFRRARRSGVIAKVGDADGRGGGRSARGRRGLGWGKTCCHDSDDSVAWAGRKNNPKPRRAETSGSRRELNNGLQAEDRSHHWVNTEFQKNVRWAAPKTRAALCVRANRFLKMREAARNFALIWPGRLWVSIYLVTLKQPSICSSGARFGSNLPSHGILSTFLRRISNRFFANDWNC